MDLDSWHSWAQFPVAAVEATVAVSMLARWRWAKRTEPLLDPTLTLMLAALIGLIALKQGFWTVWGALQAADMIATAETVRTHIWPVINNIAITLAGLAVIARACVPAIGARSYAVAGALGVAFYAIEWMR